MPWPYPDVQDTHWAAAAIRRMSETIVPGSNPPQSLMGGFADGTFQPDPDDAPAAVGLVTRAQEASLSVRLLDYLLAEIDLRIAAAVSAAVDPLTTAVGAVPQQISQAITQASPGISNAGRDAAVAILRPETTQAANAARDAALTYVRQNLRVNNPNTVTVPADASPVNSTVYNLPLRVTLP